MDEKLTHFFELWAWDLIHIFLLEEKIVADKLCGKVTYDSLATGQKENYLQ